MSEVVKRIKAPLSIDEMKEAFLNKADRDSGKIKYIIDYNNSTIKGDILLQYLSNLEIQADFDFTGTSKEDRFDFLLTYFKMKTIIKNKDLNFAAAAVVLKSKEYSGDYLVQEYLSAEEVDEFYVLNKPTVDKWSPMIDSSLLLLLRVTLPKASLDEFEEIIDPNYCGVNFVNLYRVEGFFNSLVSLPSVSPLIWFTHQFENFAFNNEMLLSWISKSDESFLAGINLMQAVTENDFDSEFIKELDLSLNELEKTYVSE